MRKYSKHSYSKLLKAIKGGKPEIVKSMLEQGANPDMSDSETCELPIFCAIHAHNLDALMLLLEHGVQTNVVDNEGYSPIEIAFKEKFAQALIILHAKRDADNGLYTYEVTQLISQLFHSCKDQEAFYAIVSLILYVENVRCAWDEDSRPVYDDDGDEVPF